jgi:glycosyltransferase involved in cell wall biosynthesis
MQRVCIFVPSMHGGGAERMMVNLSNEIAARGYAVDLVLVTAAGPYLAEIADGVRIVDLGAGSVVRSVPALVRYLKQLKPNFVISALSHANLAAIFARLLARTPTRVIISERSVLFAPWMPKVVFKERVVRWMMKLLYPYADGIVAISHGVQDDIEKWVALPPGRVRTIYNPVVTKELSELAAAPVPHDWLKDECVPVILGAGRLTAQKDFPTLIKAFAVLRKQRRCRLAILGEGELRGELEALVAELNLSEDVLMPGFIENPFPWMKGADLFVFSSIFEGLGGVLIQAMACGTPVISTDCPSGPSEILEDGRWGRLVPVGDVMALATAIELTLDEPHHPDVRRRAAFFSDKRSTDDYLAFCFAEEAPGDR